MRDVPTCLFAGAAARQGLLISEPRGLRLGLGTSLGLTPVCTQLVTLLPRPLPPFGVCGTTPLDSAPPSVSLLSTTLDTSIRVSRPGLLPQQGLTT